MWPASNFNLQLQKTGMLQVLEKNNSQALCMTPMEIIYFIIF